MNYKAFKEEFERYLKLRLTDEIFERIITFDDQEEIQAIQEGFLIRFLLEKKMYVNIYYSRFMGCWCAEITIKGEGHNTWIEHAEHGFLDRNSCFRWLYKTLENKVFNAD